MKHYLLLLIIVTGLSACSNYGEKISKDYLEVYYKKGISKEQAQKVLDYFLPIWIDEGQETAQKSIQLTKNGDTINFRMVSNMSVIDKMDEKTFYQTGNEISVDLFNGAPVNVDLTDNKFKLIRTYAYKKNTIPDFGEKVSSGNVEVFYKNGINKDEASQLAVFIEKSNNPQNIISFQLSRDEQGVFLLRMVSTPEKANSLPDSEFYNLAAEISNNVLNGATVNFQLTDDSFNPFKTIEYKGEKPAPESTPKQ